MTLDMSPLHAPLYPADAPRSPSPVLSPSPPSRALTPTPASVLTPTPASVLSPAPVLTPALTLAPVFPPDAVLEVASPLEDPSLDLPAAQNKNPALLLEATSYMDTFVRTKETVDTAEVAPGPSGDPSTSDSPAIQKASKKVLSKKKKIQKYTGRYVTIVFALGLLPHIHLQETLLRRLEEEQPRCR